jgi:hypothetical protein
VHDAEGWAPGGEVGTAPGGVGVTVEGDEPAPGGGQDRPAVAAGLPEPRREAQADEPRRLSTAEVINRSPCLMASIRLGPVNHRKLAKKLAATKVDLKEQINQN